MKTQDTAIRYIAQALRTNWGTPAFTDYQADTLRYCDVARKIAKLHILFENAGIRPGDKIALCSRNCSQWATAMLATLTYGAVAVPILHDFKPDTIHHLVTDSNSRLFFTDAAVWGKLDPAALPQIDGVFLVDDFSLLFSRSEALTAARHELNKLFGLKYPDRFTPEAVDYPDFKPTDVAVINYTAGSTGFSKGVMLTHRAIWSNLQFCIDGLRFLRPTDTMVSMLPLAHMFGLMVECLHPFVKGCHIFFLSRTPSPKIILDAFAHVRPKLVVAVPLIIEKIVKTRIFPVLAKPAVKAALHIPGVRGRILGKIKAQLMAAFGGNLLEIIIGGAALNADVEKFLRRIKFPYTVGYGMTECGPLICYNPWDTQRPGSCGRVVDRMEAEVLSPDPANVPGVLRVRGDNVMAGYYNNPDATAEVLGSDGWLNTGDICTVDPDGFVYIRGRDKNMILGPSGQNIYPEEIEQKLNNMPFVNESIIIGHDGRLKALIHPDFEAAKALGPAPTALEEAMKKNIAELNATLPAFSQIREWTIMPEEFEKTPKRSIKRYLYQH